MPRRVYFIQRRLDAVYTTLGIVIWVIVPQTSHLRLQIDVMNSTYVRAYGSHQLRLATTSQEDDRVYSVRRSITDTFRVVPGRRYFLRVVSLDRVCQYRLRLSFVTDTAIPVLLPTGKKVAVVIGISDFREISDLSYCDEDAVAWCTYLSTRGYECILLGDGKSAYGDYSPDTAFKKTVQQTIRSVALSCGPGDQMVVATSSHGIGNGRGDSALCCVDADNDGNGLYTDKEFVADVSSALHSGVQMIACFDNCFSGGMIDELASYTNMCVTTTCTMSGYGYDMTEYRHGAWTYFFLVQTLMSSSPPVNMGDAFARAVRDYPFAMADMPQISGNTKLMI